MNANRNIDRSRVYLALLAIDALEDRLQTSVTIRYDINQYGSGYVVEAAGFEPARGVSVPNAVYYFLVNNGLEA